MRFIVEDEIIGLAQYTHDDDIDMFVCWQDLDTQKGYNGKFDMSFERFRDFSIEKYKFWVTVTDKLKNQKVGVLRLGLDESCPDLAIWIYPQYRNKGYGTRSFCLALKYLFAFFPYGEISAGCYEDNTYSIKMLESIGFIRHPGGDAIETNCFTGEKTTQLEFRIAKEMLKGYS